MKIAAVTVVYNEALILPYFLRHYEYLDEIHVLYETDSTDDTLKILNRTKNVIIRNCHMEGGLDDIAKVKLMNDTLHSINADWVYVLDSDELILPPNGSPHDFLRCHNCDVVMAVMFQVYRHRTDIDLDPSLPPVPQRIHGDPDVFSTVREPNKDCNASYVKPIVVRPSRRIRFLPGNHRFEGRVRISPEFYLGVHWQMADPAIALDRRMKNRARMSKRNRENGHGLQHWNVTEDWIRAECDRHLEDPIIEALNQVNHKSPKEIVALSEKPFIKEEVMADTGNQFGDRENQIRELHGQMRLHILNIRREARYRVASRIAWRFHPIVDAVLPPHTRRRLLARLIFSRLVKGYVEASAR